MNPALQSAISLLVAERGETCVACLGSRQCWVCLGRGFIEDRSHETVNCEACSGSGVCPHCSRDTAAGR